MKTISDNELEQVNGGLLFFCKRQSNFDPFRV
jgi:bacteriocin-like protein